MQDMRIEGNGKFPDEAGPGVAIENLVQFFGIVRCRIDNLSVFKREPYSVKCASLVNRSGVEGDMPFDGVFNRRREYFTIGNVVRAAASDRGNSLDGETQIGAR